MQYLWIGLILLFIILLGISYHFARVIAYPKVSAYEAVYEAKVQEGTLNESDWAAWEKEELWIPSRFGYQLHAFWLPVKETVGTVILVHGITANHYSMIKYVLPFRNRNFNVLMYDHRNHGKSGGTTTTYGFFEKEDLKQVVDWVIEATNSQGSIGTLGESLGAATCLQHAAIDTRLSFVVSDCSFANLMDLLNYRIKTDYQLPGEVILPFGAVFVRIMAGFWLQNVTPVKMVPEVSTPIFFIHGAADSYIPPDHTERLFAAKNAGFRKLWLAPNAEHVRSQPENPELYDQKMGEFLNEISII